MNTATFDTLSAARSLEAAGIESKQAEAIVGAIRSSGEASVTKADLTASTTALRGEMKARATELRGEMAGYPVTRSELVARNPWQPAGPRLSSYRRRGAGSHRRCRATMHGAPSLASAMAQGQDDPPWRRPPKLQGGVSERILHMKLTSVAGKAR